MKKGAEPLDILAEYDFSEGVGGKYASRFQGEKRRELVSAAAALDRQAWLAHSLLSFQALESYLVAYVVLVLRQDPENAGRAVTSLMEFRDQGVLATLQRDLNENTSVPQTFYSELFELIADRNWLVHHSFHSHATSRLQSIADRSTELAAQLLTLLLERCQREGMKEVEVRAKIDDAVERWAAGKDAA